MISTMVMGVVYIINEDYDMEYKGVVLYLKEEL